MLDESEWEEASSSSESSNKYSGEESAYKLDNKKPSAGPKKRSKKYVFVEKNESIGEAQPKRRRKRLRRVNFDAYDDDITHLPTSERLTERGGYAHTKTSRMKISHANRGNTPWNKGKTRTGTTKAKISAGVKARNHALLLVKLQKLGLTEEEWMQKRKQIKYLRERVRRAKRAAEQHAQSQEEQKKKGLLVRQLVIAEKELQVSDEDTEESEKEDIIPGDDRHLECDVTLPRAAELPVDNQLDKSFELKGGKEPRLTVFSRDMSWHPHPLDSNGVSYDCLCVNGGPGGLICCSACTASYSKFLSQTWTDMETQLTAKTAQEVKELINFTKTQKSILAQTIKTARRKPAPIRPKQIQKSKVKPRSKSPPAHDDKDKSEKSDDYVSVLEV